MFLSGLELLAICAIVGGLFGLIFKSKTTSSWIGFLLGAVGAAITTFLLTQFVFQSMIAMPVYGVLGSWLFNAGFRKIIKQNTSEE